jgi:hypothetical protein
MAWNWLEDGEHSASRGRNGNGIVGIVDKEGCVDGRDLCDELCREIMLMTYDIFCENWF